MIIGNGDIATALKKAGVDRPDFVFFASGVSNSQETREKEFERELDLFTNIINAEGLSKHFVYFSSLSIFYKISSYTHHKMEMEKFIKTYLPNYTIIRIGNIDWGNNPNTIINYFKNKVKKNEPVEIRDEYRYIVSKDEFIYWIKMIPEWSCEMNIPGKRMKVQEIFDTYAKHT